MTLGASMKNLAKNWRTYSGLLKSNHMSWRINISNSVN